MEGRIQKNTPIHRIERKIDRNLFDNQRGNKEYGELLHKLLKTSKDNISEKTKNIPIIIRPEETVESIYGLEKCF